MKRLFLATGTLILLLSAVLVWRITHPALTDHQQIAANLDGIADAASRRSARGVANFLSKDFDFNGTNKRDFQNQLVAGLLQYRVVELKLNGVQTNVNGDSASSAGRYNLSLKSEYNSPPQVSTGEFKLKWRKIDGEWKVVGGQGTAPGLG